ncbi:hypothetical protein R6Q59_011113 [Mikania micrantha]
MFRTDRSSGRHKDNGFWAKDVQGFGKRVKDIHRRFDALIEKVIKEHEETPSQEDLLSMLLHIAEDETMDIRLTRENIKAFILGKLIRKQLILKKKNKKTHTHKYIFLLKFIICYYKVKNVIMGNKILIKICRSRIYIYNTWALGRDPNHWENPLEFRPEIFEEKQMDVRGQHFEFLPFGSGRRMCPGTSLGLKMVYTTFGAMIQCFEWKAGEDGNLARVDMDEVHGISLPKANHFVCVPVAQIDPISMSIDH